MSVLDLVKPLTHKGYEEKLAKLDALLNAVPEVPEPGAYAKLVTDSEPVAYWPGAMGTSLKLSSDAFTAPVSSCDSGGNPCSELTVKWALAPLAPPPKPPQRPYIEASNAWVKDRALAEVNMLRTEYGMTAIEALPEGVRKSRRRCPLARALGGGFEVSGLLVHPEFGTRATPPGMREFIYRMDAGSFPELCAPMFVGEIA